MKNLYNMSWMFIAAIALTFTSCSKSSSDPAEPCSPGSYEFLVDESSTVFYDGQTARLQMAGQIMDAMNSNTSTVEMITDMFDNGTGFEGNLMGTSTPLDETGKKVGSKTAATATADATVKSTYFDAMISEFVNDVIPSWDVDAAAGVAGVYTGDGGRTVRVNAKGMELNQCFGKGLIGALCVDQIANGYLANCYGNSSYDNETRNPDKSNSTEMEHKFDEGFGYLFGLASNGVNPLSDYNSGDVLLAKYTDKVDGAQEEEIACNILNAFVDGRQAIVDLDYENRDSNIDIIRNAISRVVVYKSVSYLRDAATDKESGDMADYFHSLSEGHGFIFSLQFTYGPNGSPYFTNSQVDGMLDELMAGNGYWDRTPEELRQMANDIEASTGVTQ
tara:strand:- start:283 stop:1452 length:1170 start_codon:yes stop_codon:yes gene_type:complete